MAECSDKANSELTNIHLCNPEITIAMSSIFQRLVTYLTPGKTSRKPVPHLQDGQQTAKVARSKRMASMKNETKRKAETTSEEPLSKRLRKSEELYGPDIRGDSDVEDQEAQIKGKTAADSLLMPPPLSPRAYHPVKTSRSRIRGGGILREGDHEDESSLSFSTARHTNSALDEYDMEQARRHAAAIRLPENSGAWARAEQELFYHLALRGFEPLLPRNWMLDFKTLPLSLYEREHGEDQPLIQNLKDSEFRSIRALRDLIETGKVVRDKRLASPGFHAEMTLQKAVSKYLAWAMADAGVLESSPVPIHSIVTRRKGQPTSETLAELTDTLHMLAIKHRKLHCIYPSIELLDHPASTEATTTKVHDDEDGLPVLTGLMIVSSVLAVFTLNAHVPPPLSHNPKNLPSASGRRHSATGATEESGLRFIATFDFSDPAHDVWNALSVAIVAMQIRKTMLENPCPGTEMAPPRQRTLDESLASTGDESDDPDA